MMSSKKLKTMSVRKLNIKHKELCDMISDLESEKEKVLDFLQKKCKHPKNQVFEIKYMSFTSGGSLPPFRVCKTCGYAEEGWGCGYKELKDFNGGVIDRQEALGFVRKFHTQSDLYGD